jgi:hypothetical protein
MQVSVSELGKCCPFSEGKEDEKFAYLAKL